MTKAEWDEEKNRANRKKHHVWFEEAATIFNDPHGRHFIDQDHSDHEDRFVGIGHSSAGRLLVVIYTYREPIELIRIISARKAKKKERTYYEKGV